MNAVTPITAYDMIDPSDKVFVDDYINFVKAECRRQGSRIANAIGWEIPDEMVKRSRGVLGFPLTRVAIGERIRDLANEQDISPSRVIAEHAYIAFSNMADYLKFTPNGQMEIDLNQCSREQLAAVKSIKTHIGPGGIKTELQLYEKTTSLIELTKIMDMPTISDLGKAGDVIDHQSDDPAKAYTEVLEQTKQ